ncbi:MAG: NAD(P)H-dependent oxidoreductase subunit E [Nitrospiraceae bacterium]|nr:NAD(P)H-dependent oxidoreductase subunit E [Nitrospiraceae bacterium]
MSGCIPDMDSYYRIFEYELTDEQRRRGVLIYALQQIQKEHNYLPADQLARLSESLNMPLSEIYSTATFYKHFYFKPRGRNIACVCTGTACHVRGAGKVVEKFKKEFGIQEGQTSEDGSLTLETVGCVGCCGLAPVITVNEEVIGDLSDEKLSGIISSIKDNDTSSSD